ncbi:hypothetical protein DPMN_093999 [Dreissena polymorpha]|uniref:Uncharacterized protein n=1 Tax=Dreissena polymorpha TaxID=45954 RepID=A0A9D4L6L1_DREPO|nr:hypothetical protein DPMN_093999 [Dreissena polymorpha]
MIQNTEPPLHHKVPQRHENGGQNCAFARYAKGRRSEEIRRELKPQTARHQLERAELEDEEDNDDTSSEKLSLPDGTQADEKVRDIKCSGIVWFTITGTYTSQ